MNILAHESYRTNQAFNFNMLGFCNVVFEYSGSNPVYIGYALPGTASGESKWLIFKHTFDGNGNMTSKYAADGEFIFNKAWDDRASYTYTATGS